MAGEIALERLQRAGEQRVSQHGREYTNHYDLAASLLELAREKLPGKDVHDAALGRVDLLFALLSKLAICTPEDLARYVDALHSDLERRPLAEQVIDQILIEEPGRYAAFEQIRTLDIPALSLTSVDLPRVSQSEAIGQFMSLWIEYEKMLRAHAASKGAGGAGIPSMRILRLVENVPSDLNETAERLRRFRNQLVHGIEVPDAEFIRAHTSDLQHLVSRLKAVLSPPLKPARKSTGRKRP